MVEKQYKELRSRRVVAVQRQWLCSIGFSYIPTSSVLKIKRVKCNTGPVRQMKQTLTLFYIMDGHLLKRFQLKFDTLHL